MNIFVGVNRKYLPPLRVMLASLLRTNPGVPIQLYLLHAELTEEDIAWAGELPCSEALHIHPVQLNASDYAYISPKAHWGVETYFRLLPMVVFPQDMERVMWMDADVLVQDSLAEFYNQPLGDHYAAVVRRRDSVTPLTGRMQREFGAPEGQDYFYAGIILYNLPALRKDFAPDAFLRFYRENEEKIVTADQDILNAMLGSNAVWTDCKWNYYVYPQAEWRMTLDRRKKPPILHFTDANKPWMATYCMRPGYALLYRRQARRAGVRVPGLLARVPAALRIFAGFLKSLLYRLLKKCGLVRKGK